MNLEHNLKVSFEKMGSADSLESYENLALAQSMERAISWQRNDTLSLRLESNEVSMGHTGSWIVLISSTNLEESFSLNFEMVIVTGCVS